MKIVTSLLQIRRSLLLWSLAVLLCLAGVGSIPASLPLDPLFALTVRVFPDSVGVGGFACSGCNGILDSGDREMPLP
ncbi:MAG: hypothetical protein ACE5LU_08755, partial [Anaerolineae bacterium]